MPMVWGFPLNNIGIFIGIIYLIQSAICVVYTSIKLAQYVQETKEAKAAGIPFDGVKETKAILATLLSISLTGIITSSLLIWGTIKKKHFFFIPWLLIASSLIIVTGFYLFAIVFTLIWYSLHPAIHPGNRLDGSTMKIVILALALTLQIAIYKTIKSLYRELIFERQVRLIETSSAIYIIQEEETDQR